MHLGKEIYLFFGSYGIKGIAGLIISCIITGIIIYKVFLLIINRPIYTYNGFLGIISKNKIINYIVNIVINIFLLISFFIMVAGFSAYFKQEFKMMEIIRKRNYLYILLYYIY